MSDPCLDFGTELRRFRTGKDLSLTKLSALVNYSKGHISKVENGRVAGNRPLAEACDQVLDTGGALVALVQESADRPATTGRPLDWYLPPTTAHFVGREVELRTASTWLSGEHTPTDGLARACVVSGMAGIGKTAFAVRAAERERTRFPDGFLFLDLHGYGGTTRVSPASALDRLLRRLGVPPSSIPDHPDDRSALLHHHLGRRRLLLILDNVLDTAQVAPLITNTSSSHTLITSRGTLPALDEAHRIPLGPLPEHQANRLVHSLTGGSASPRLVHRATSRCGGLPLALRIASARIRAEDDLAGWKDGGRVEDIEDGERRLRTAFDHSVDRLDPEQRLLFTLCGLHPGTGFDAWSAAALGGLPHRTAFQLLHSLRDAGLLHSTGDQRFAFHDLMRLHARGRAETDLSPDERLAARTRLVDHYVESAGVADLALSPNRHRMAPVPEGDGARTDVGVYDGAMRWFAAELDNIVEISGLAHDLRLDRRCWELAYASRGYLFTTRAWEAWARTHEAALASADRARNRAAKASTHNNLGLLLAERGDHGAARKHYLRARALFRELNDPHGEHVSVAHLAWAHFREGSTEAALAESRAALRFQTCHGNPRNRAIVQRDTASIEIAAGQSASALEKLNDALSTFTDLGLHVDRVMTLNELGEAYRSLGLWEPAQDVLETAVLAARASGSDFERARAHELLFEVSLAGGRRAAAGEHAHSAIDLYSALADDERADRLRTALNSARERRTPAAHTQGEECPQPRRTTTSSSATRGETNQRPTPS